MNTSRMMMTSSDPTTQQTQPSITTATSTIQMNIERQSTDSLWNEMDNEQEWQTTEIGIPLPFERTSAASLSTRVSTSN